MFIDPLKSIDSLDYNSKYRDLGTKAPRLKVFYEGVETVQANKLNSGAYYHFRLREGTNRNLAILRILATIKGYYISRKIHLQIDPSLPIDQIGVIVQTIDDPNL